MSQLEGDELEAAWLKFLCYVRVLPCGCWEWIGGRSGGKGNKLLYGSFWWKGKTYRAHTFAHDKLAGKICPPGHHRDHTCVFSLCVRPDHIEAVTPEENQRRKMERARETKNDPV